MRARKVGLSVAELVGLFRRGGYLCEICGDTPAECVDHIVPTSRDCVPEGEVDNLQIACIRCNSRKARQLPSEFGFGWDVGRVSHLGYMPRPKSLSKLAREWELKQGTMKEHF